VLSDHAAILLGIIPSAVSVAVSVGTLWALHITQSRIV
jgi:hypothetical protein